MSRKYDILILLFLIVAGGYVMTLDSSLGLILSIIALLYSMLTKRVGVLVQDSYEVSRKDNGSYFQGDYCYFGRNLDSYVLLFKMFVKFGVLTVGYSAVSALFVYLGDSRFTVIFSIVYLVWVFWLRRRTVERIHWSNPKFNLTLVEAGAALTLTSCSFIAWFFSKPNSQDFEFTIVKIILLILICTFCYIVPIRYYYYEINETATYQIKIHGNVDTVFPFQFKTVDGKVWELKEDFAFLVIQDSGDYCVILPDKSRRIIKKEEIENFGYFAEESYGDRLQK